jgi:hypothetical protein
MTPADAAAELAVLRHFPTDPDYLARERWLQELADHPQLDTNDRELDARREEAA